MTSPTTEEAAALAIQFHDTYERLAPGFGYETRPDTKKFDPESANGRLMIAVCEEIVRALVPRADMAEGVEFLLWQYDRKGPVMECTEAWEKLRTAFLARHDASDGGGA